MPCHAMLCHLCGPCLSGHVLWVAWNQQQPSRHTLTAAMLTAGVTLSNTKHSGCSRRYTLSTTRPSTSRCAGTLLPVQLIILCSLRHWIANSNRCTCQHCRAQQGTSTLCANSSPPAADGWLAVLRVGPHLRELHRDPVCGPPGELRLSSAMQCLNTWLAHLVRTAHLPLCALEVVTS